MDRAAFTFVLISCVVYVNAWDLGLRYTGYFVPDWVPVTHSTHNYIAHCLATCMFISTCTGIYYDDYTHDCQHFDVDHFEFWWSNNHNESIVLAKPMKVVLVTEGNGFNFAFNDAINKCAELRGRLMTQAEMDTLWNDGFEKCSCGWVADGVNVMPDHGGCGNSPEVIICNVQLAHAYCILN